jgi:hypothetical protein
MGFIRCFISATIAVNLSVLCRDFDGFAHAQTIPDKAMSTPLRIDAQGPLIEILVDGQPARLLYDSGAGALVLFEQSFPNLAQSVVERYEAPVFGGSQNAVFKRVRPVSLTWGDINIERPFVNMVDHSSFLSGKNDTPFFEGILGPITVKNEKHESVIIFDAPNKVVKHLTPGKKAKFKKSKSFKLKRDKSWHWRVEMPVILEGETQKRILNLVVDTGAAQGLILNQEKLGVIGNTSGFVTVSRGLGGQSEDVYGGRSRIFIGKESVLVDTDIAQTLPFAKDADGFLGWPFLRRFRIAYDFERGKMIIDRQDGDFEDDKIRPSTFKATGYPVSDWMGFKVTEVGTWKSAGLEKGDILRSVDDIRLSSTAMYSVLKSSAASPIICWQRENVRTETCGQVSIP